MSKKTPERLLLAIQLRQRGMCYAQIGKIIDVHQQHIRRWLDPEYEQRVRVQQKASKKRFRERWRCPVSYDAYVVAERANRRPTVPYVRCLEGRESSAFKMVRP